MSIIQWFTQEEMERIDHFQWGSPCEKQEMIWVYETILSNAEDEEIREAVSRLLKVMRREE